MSTTTITIKTNTALRNEAKKLADELGISLTAIVNAQLKRFVKDRKFTVSAEPMPTKEKLALWEQISEEMDKGVNVSGPFTSAEQLIKHLKL